MAALTSIPLGQPEASAQFLRRVGGIAAMLLGAALLADIAVFAAYVSSTGVTVPGDNPAAQPVAFAHQLANGAASPFWIWYLVLAGLAVFAFTTVDRWPTISASPAPACRFGHLELLRWSSTC